jgi:hypothetical protein
VEKFMARRTWLLISHRSRRMAVEVWIAATTVETAKASAATKNNNV